MIFAMALAALASCSEQEQSELNFTDIQGTATISGQVTYDNGFRTDNGATVKSEVPAANIPVIAKVDYKNYSTKAEGIKIVEVTTDAEGKYSLTIPCGQKAVNVTVQPRAFTAPYFSMLTDGQGQVKTIEVNAFYEPTELTKSVVMNDNQTANFLNLMYNGKENVTKRSIALNFNGKVDHKYPNDRDSDAGKNVTLSQNTTVKVRVYCDEKDAEEKRLDGRELVATGNVSGGNYTLNITLFDDWDVSKLKADITIGGFKWQYDNNEDPKKTINCYYEDLKVDGKELNNVMLLNGVGCKQDFLFDTKTDI